MTATITETALDTGRKIHAKTANAHRIAAILDVPPGLQTSATAGMIITLGMALAPNTRWKEKSVTVKRLRRVASNDSIPRPRPLHYMAANLLDAIDARGTGTLSDSFQHQAQLCREQTADTAAALEQLTPMREETSVFHTTGPAATLMAHLTVPGHLDWSKPASLAALTIADYACGHGALLASVYQRARDLHRAAGGDPARLHSQMMENNITGTDISAAATALTVENLACLEPNRGFAKTRIAQLPHGPTADGGEPRLGALDLLTSEEIQLHAIASKGHTVPLPPEAYAPDSQQIIVMNPPFTRHILNHGQENPSEAEPHQTGSQQLLQRVANTCQTTFMEGLAHPMAILALRNTAPGGNVGLILPLSAASGATPPPQYDGKLPRGWTAFRHRVLNEFANITVITSAHYSDRGNAFSNDTTIAEAMITATKLTPGQPPPRTVTFVNIHRMPATPEEAQSLASRIKSARSPMQPGDIAALPPGPGPSGHLYCRTIAPGTPWNGARKLAPDTVLAADALAQGRTKCGPTIPMTTLGQLAHISQCHDARTTYGRTSPASGEIHNWLMEGHNCATDTKMAGRAPTPLGDPAPSTRLKHAASRLQVSDNTRLNSQPTTACITPHPTVAGKGWAAVKTRRADYEKPLALWLNTTMGLITYWSASNQTQNGRCYASLTALKNLPVPDLRQMRQKQVDRMNAIFDGMAHLELMPASHAWHDPVRLDIDRLTLETLLDGEGTSGPSLAATRTKWCLEPTVQGRKGLAETDRSSMAALRKEAQTAERATAKPTLHIHQECLTAAMSQSPTAPDAVCSHCRHQLNPPHTAAP